MKNLLLYYAAIFIPFFLIIYLSKVKLLDTDSFLVLLIVYAFIYRSITDYIRLKSKNIIDKKQFWTLFIPGTRIKYFRELYFV